MNRPDFREHQIRFDEKDQPLRRDVHWLGATLGQLIQELAPSGTYEVVETARVLARRRRRGHRSDGAKLDALLRDLSTPVALEVVRAFSAYFGVVNTAEQVHRQRRQLDYLRAGELQPGSLRAVVATLHRRGAKFEELEAALRDLCVIPVFTAHPTEAVRRTLLKKEQRLASSLLQRSSAEGVNPVAQSLQEECMRTEMATSWQTEEQIGTKPTVQDEVEHVLFYLSEVLYRAAPDVHEELERAIEEFYGQRLPLRVPVLRFASWVGGDMDGNPNVHAGTIRATLERHLELALRRYQEDLRELHEHLSQSTTRVGFDAAITKRIQHYAELLGGGEELLPTRYADMPYRQLLHLMSERLTRKQRQQPGGYGPQDELRDDLECIATSLEHHQGVHAGCHFVRRVMRCVDIFGFHLASLDVRQDAAVFRVAVGEWLAVPEFSKLDSEERTRHLATALAAPIREPSAELSAETRKTLEVFQALAEALHSYGPRALGLVIISMAQGPDDALAVLLLARAAGCIDEQGRVPFDVVPLLETVDDLAAGPSILRALFRDPTYATHLKERRSKQVVMLGYSDSSKDGGIAAARIELDRSQAALAAIGAELGPSIEFFHGRGGSISRGGSKPRAGILAVPRGAMGRALRTTEQGEIIAAKFGWHGIAIRTLEVSLGALLERSVGEDPTPLPNEEARAIAETIASQSRATYQALVKEEPRFVEFFEGMTPIDVIEKLPIGSRPSRRREMKGVRDLRAIPWVFAWTQCRALLPGWYGMGSGLAQAIEAHGIDAVRRAVREWPFFATLLRDVEMVLAKSDIQIASAYAALAGEAGEALFPRLAAEHALSISSVLEVFEVPRLLENDPALQRSIRLRNPYVDPMSFVQIGLLKQWRAGGRTDPDLERVLVQTVRGIARGLRNTG